ncbi:hypothetical protein BDP27DRAFT_439135 [Rhodocollybia butyracea]|uniref:Uncharacterized protein n=1 Tax=Rhodocollybia butyracea TaxID=206335 RepID=A0A9P5TZ45_9AGAR|nr:hypothetical protein BDP27DRAFT_439135 [Rhodocollybia butyracea]
MHYFHSPRIRILRSPCHSATEGKFRGNALLLEDDRKGENLRESASGGISSGGSTAVLTCIHRLQYSIFCCFEDRCSSHCTNQTVYPEPGRDNRLALTFYAVVDALNRTVGNEGFLAPWRGNTAIAVVCHLPT